MTESAVLTWTAVALLGVITPGIDTMLVLRHTLLGGRRAGLSVVVGITAGCLVWATAGLAGLTALLTASHLAYDAVRILGAAYLVWLGVSTLWRTLPTRRRRDPNRTGRHDDEESAGPEADPRHGLRSGLVTNLLNPKVGVFYLSLLPQFLPVGPGATRWGALLVTIHLVVTLAWYPALILVAARARGVLLGDRVRAWMDRLTATVMIGVGIRLATEAHRHA